jgi:hypothetical protein
MLMVSNEVKMFIRRSEAVSWIPPVNISVLSIRSPMYSNISHNVSKVMEKVNAKIVLNVKNLSSLISASFRIIPLIKFMPIIVA